MLGPAQGGLSVAAVLEHAPAPVSVVAGATPARHPLADFPCSVD